MMHVGNECTRKVVFVGLGVWHGRHGTVIDRVHSPNGVVSLLVRWDNAMPDAWVAPVDVWELAKPT